ncbi:putative NAD/FAD-dependent oxidoreductase [Synechococcus sp. PCC 7502]|uniref:NAD(P)/FAD-dependent oxidoreductase n=1 Tax=Synechococcus sp. PCC 7502 TaxID=1173263 RepID=UPI00029F8326|nr:FAD-dependent oxidoreductase [Synechococcus sp. PCC 7502]AFY72623.1 putative NAD/FAD-dependent oxidoreductase [Synechococcus sp. PCC 7502]
MYDVVVIGAGLAGLSCGKELRQAGLNIKIVEKAAGVGGRLATRRLQGTWADHGAQYVSVHNEVFGRFIHSLEQQGIVKEWTRSITQLSPDGSQFSSSGWLYPRYTSPFGMTAIAKHLATDQDILLKTRIVEVKVQDQQWYLTTETGEQIFASAIVSTIPAPQFLGLFQSVLGANSQLLKTVQSVKFHPNITVMAGYAKTQAIPEQWRAFRCVDDFILSWISYDSSKHPDQVTQPVFVFQSTSQFARHSLEETDLEKVGKAILLKAGEYLDSWLSQPEWWQLQRWRYALVEEALEVDCLTTKMPLPLVCAGDWCAGKNLEGAYCSGIAASSTVRDLINR